MAHHQKVHSSGVKHAADPADYEKTIYAKGLHFERPLFTFRSDEWEPQAQARMSAESAGYVVGNAGTGETAQKNRTAFRNWSIVPKRLIKTETLPDLSTKVLGQDLQFPLAVAPVGVQRKSPSDLFEGMQSLMMNCQASSIRKVKRLSLGRLPRRMFRSS